MTWLWYNLTFDVELTTHCNLKCPQCSRTDHKNNLNKMEWLPLTSVSLKDFMKWFPPTIIQSIGCIHFSGTYGDPGMCKDLLEIVKYLALEGTCRISINTNGSMRDEEFWFNLAAWGGSRLQLIFDVDGIDQEMHSFYRRGSDLNKVLDAIEVTSGTDANIKVLTVLFKHNQDYLEDIRNMVNERVQKPIKFDEVEGNNFQHTGSKYEFLNENGETEILEQVTRQDREQGLERRSRRVRDHRHKDIVTNIKSNESNLLPIEDKPIIPQVVEPVKQKKKEYEINCLAVGENNIKVQASGMVSPCCYLSTSLERAAIYQKDQNTQYMITSTGKHADPKHPLMQEYVDNWKDFNLHYSSIYDIMESTWFKEKLPGHWETPETACHACVKVCGKLK
ncbi:radical SAM protein [bacterium]|nr:radical SAM protein [bacterium]